MQPTTQDKPTLFEQTLRYFDGDELRARVFCDKYALRDLDGNVVERTPPEMWARVAREIASVEPTDAARAEWEERFYWLLSDFRMIPGGRILFAAGNPRRVTAANCYVIPIHGDSLEDIFEWCKQAARTYSFGGGVGGDISVLRPRGTPVNNAAITSTGAVSFMELMSTTTGTIGQAGRRGALMITIANDHPDVLEFTRVKRNLDKVRYANISVRVFDEFMRAVERDGDYELRYETDKVRLRRTIRARDLWKELIAGARDHAEPGVIFWDTIKRWSTSEYNGMGVITTNPCSEIPLEPYGNCNLSNVNLARFVLDAFTDRARVDWQDLERALRYTVRFLDNVLDYNADKHPLPEQREASLRSRRIGVGFTGLGDMLVKLGLRYDTTAAIEFADTMFERIKNIVYDESVNLAVEKGTFPAFDRDRHLEGAFLQTLHPKVLARIRECGLRNVALLTVPPVGSGAALAGTTSGIEPIFDLSYTRRSESLSQGEFRVWHPLVREYMERFGLQDDTELPETFVTAHRIRPEMRVRMQAAIQKHIDHSISSTVNLPEHATLEDVEQIYFLAWKLGLKGITVYREGSREGVLITEAKTQQQSQGAISVPAAEPARGGLTTRPRPKVTQGRTERIETPRGRAYVTVNEDEYGPCEVFVESLDVEAEAIGRLTSVCLRSGVDPREVIEQLWRVSSREVALDRTADGTVVRVSTIAQAVALALGRALYGDAFRPDKEFPRALSLPPPQPRARQEPLRFHAGPPPDAAAGNGKGEAEVASFAGVCPDCGDTLAYQNGCATCRSCGYSRC
ncbi:MAG: adenosylcobalamin-dependent ribonucleoside-diphosphate reductase [Armatimonadota bacterium]|nr:adenosylcobalamin-dependent ribonucleoside-diphosphate reductase [Armatimonadota bacterium]MDR5696690.1 adenosylcobalamin-dependent ribonucleoside-diphosphate reductase [Armatimonadota bacterium]